MSAKAKLMGLLVGWLRNHIPVGRLSYSQEGEDLVLARILDQLESKSRFFVDIGAHHPVRLSNTYYFYRRGWRGINVDARPGTKKLFKRMRPDDITLECGVGSKEGALKYYQFNEPALNTFSEQHARRSSHPPYRIIGIKDVPMVPLRKILDDHLPRGTAIDFMTIDVEGLDRDVILSNDWARYRPRVLLVELLDTDIQALDGNPTAQFLQSHNYRVLAKGFNTFFFVANDAFPQSQKAVR